MTVKEWLEALKPQMEKASKKHLSTIIHAEMQVHELHWPGAPQFCGSCRMVDELDASGLFDAIAPILEVEITKLLEAKNDG